ncbi:restriction endonuclease subunit S [Botrimarina mediterranea]|uniref:restriction endonuclease subunit S n=1 Tax=Botrimarina mediterranea TaxID=2528022 RepID=UPI0018D3B63C|nr:restriction endonuclease subunit S [Botrimarina mediterranea]
MYGTNGPVGWTDSPLANGPGVILGRKGAYRGVEYSKGPFFVIDTAYYVVPKSNLDMRWLYYAIKHHDLGGIDDGSPIPSTTRAAVYPRPLAVPRLQEQRAIAGVLGALDDKIEQNRRTAAGLEKLARAIFRAWFVDFEPVHAKAAGAKSFPGMPPAVFDSLPTRLVDSELGPIPEGWRVGPLRELCDLSKEQVTPMSHADELFDHFSLPAFDASRRPVTEPGFGIKSSKFIVPPGCVLISKLNPRIPRIWLPGESVGRRQIASTEFLVLQPKAGVSRERIYCQVGETSFLEALTQTATGTSNSHQRVKPQDFMATPVIHPSVTASGAFEHQVIPMMDRIQQMSDESRKLAELRDYLLPKLLSGEVRVKAASDEEAA